MTAVMKNRAIPRTFAFEKRVMVNHHVSLLNLTLGADIPSDVMWSFIDGKHIVSVPHHDGLFVDRVDDCLDEEIDGGTAHKIKDESGVISKGWCVWPAFSSGFIK